jgi:deoxyuridine 5'-triphosphate nucleotidohydrolase
MSHNNHGEVRRSARLAGFSPQTDNNVPTTMVPPPPQLPPPPPIAPTTSNNQPYSPHSSELLSESLNTYSDHHSNFNQPHPNRNTTMLHQQPSATPMHNNTNAPKQVYHNNDHQPIQHVRGTNTIPNFVQHYQSPHPMEPTSNHNVNHQYNRHYNPPHYHQPPPMVAPPNQFHQQFDQLRHQLQLEHQQQLQQLESRFEERLQQNTLTLSQTLATTLGNTLKTHLKTHNTNDTYSSSVTTVPNLLEFDSNQPEPKSGNKEPSSHLHQAPILEEPNKTNNSTNTANLAKLLLASKEPKLYFQSFKPTLDYDNWKYMCILKTHKHTLHTKMTTKDDDGNIIFNPNMTDDESSTLFMLTMEALGTHADKMSIGVQQANGIQLWNLLDRFNLDIDMDVTNQESLSKQFESLKRENNEDYDAFAIRFVKKMKQLRNNGVAVTTDKKRLAFKLLRGLNEQVINNKICMELGSKPEWYVNITIPEIASKAKRYMKHYESLHIGSPTCKPSKPSPKPVYPAQPTETPAKATNPYVKPTKPAPPAQPNKEPKKEVNEDQVMTMMNAMRNATDRLSFLKDLKLRDYNKFRSMETRNACSRLQNYDLWYQAAKGGKQQPPDNDTTPTPPPPPPAARRVEVTDQVSQASSIQDQVQSALNEALGPQGMQLLAEIQSVNSTLHTEEMTENDDNNSLSNNNTNVNHYSNTVYSNSNKRQRVAKLLHLLQRLKQRIQSSPRIPRQSTLPTIQEEPSHTSRPNVIATCASAVQTPTSSRIPLPNSGHYAVIDSGATDTMSAHAELFEEITYFSDTKHAQPQVMLGDENTYHPVSGYGWINYIIDGHRVRQPALYIPALGNTTLISVKQHMKWEGNYFHAENNQATIAYPTFQVSLHTRHEIAAYILPVRDQSMPIDFNEATAIPTPSSSTPTAKSIKLVSKVVHDYIPDKTKHPQFAEKVQIMKLTPTASLPRQSTPGSIGHDVTCTHDTIIAPGEIAKLSTGLSTALPKGMYIRIAPRSSYALKHQTIEGGVIDNDFRGEIKVLMKNNSSKPTIIKTGDRIAQFIFEKAAIPYLEITTSLTSTQRNKGGFGSTNKPRTIRRSQFQMFRLDKDYVIYTNNTNPFRPVSRRAPVPLRSEPQLIIPSNESTKDTAAELIDTQPNIPFTKITTHDINSKTHSPVDPILAVDLEPIPTIMEKCNLEPIPEEAPLVTPIPVDTVNNALPKRVTLSREALHRAIGFQNPTLLTKNIHRLGTKSVQIQNIQQAEAIDPGETASMHSARCNTKPLPSPDHYSDIWHMDIGYGPNASIGGIKYTLLLIDKFSRYKFLYGLKNLTTSLHAAINQFLLDCAVKPRIIRTDFDHKLMGGEVASILKSKHIRVESAPPYRQHQNGMVERHWQTLVNMARNWLSSSMLPVEYWYFAIKRACEVSNMLPIKKNGKLTTPYELVYNKKVDYRALFPLFSIAYIRQHREEGQDKNKWTSKSLKCVLVGKCNKSDSLLFYHPPSKQTLSCSDGYRFDTFSPAGPQFGKHYDGDFIFNIKSSMDAIHKPPTHESNSTVYVQIDGAYKEAKVLNIPINDDSEPYTIQEVNTGEIHQMLAEEILDHDPSATPTDIPTSNIPFPHLQWLQNGEKVTLFLPQLMKKPKQGKIYHDSQTNQWSFRPGRFGTNDPIGLPNFPHLVDSMIANKKLFKGWINSTRAITARRLRATSNLLSHLIINRKVSAANLHLLEAPTLLKHYKLHPDDKITWDEAYRQEYEGLMDIDTWEVISEEEYNNMKHILGSLLPTMAISVIKHDGNGKPVRAKYRIVALGNLDPHDWSKNDCSAPVLSQMELRFLTALAAKQKCIPKTGDITQAFCQSYLPKGEEYVCRPPAGCPLTPPKTYWKLKKTLYGLKRSPRHFYELAKKTLISIGLQQHPTSPCIFYGTLIEGHPPLYLGLYVDDFFYFSSSKDVENKFENDFGKKIDMEFNGPVTYFLGIKFTTKTHESGDVSIKMSQEAFVEALTSASGLQGDGVTEPRTPYRIGYPVDKIKNEDYDEDTQHKLTHLYRVLIGSLNWLSISTRPDISTITNMLAKYSSNPSKGHIDQAKRVIKYLKGTKEKGILFTSKNRNKLESFVKFPIPPSEITSMTDANWGPQDQSKPTPANIEELELFKSRSISGYLIWLGGPVHWLSKRQSITARSSAEAEIYATDECTKQLIHLSYLIDGLCLTNDLMHPPTTIYNDNSACVCWSKATTTKGLRHIQMRENAIREAVATDFVSVQHIEGKLNLADMFTKEDRDTEHFIQVRDHIMTDSIQEEL